MTISGKSFIAGQWQADQQQTTFQAVAPATNELLPQQFTNASSQQLESAVQAAKSAFSDFAHSSVEQRAQFLNTVAEQILELGDELINVTHLETGLPVARLQGERMRTVNQLKIFADTLLNPVEPELADLADPDRQPLPKPATRLASLPLGPVAVFGASNFPYAFSAAGGDTASAWAAGCPVVVKGHPAHPATSELVTSAINKAIEICQLPVGVFSLLQSAEADLAHQLVKHPLIKAVGFTGSLKVALLLQQSISQRAEIIPFYGELGSINPQIVLEDKFSSDSEALAQGLTSSMLMGQGQFCTSPGVWLVPENCEQFNQQVASFLSSQGSAPLLTQGILASYQQATSAISAQQGIKPVGENKTAVEHHPTALVFQTDAKTFIASKQLQEEVFGPFALIVTYANQEELLQLVEQLDGQLTASIHGSDSDLRSAQQLVNALGHKVGRLIFNQMPTGVEICHSMNHGGPFPSSTDVRSTSVGTQAMKRFQRPICYQNMPEFLQG